MAAKRAILWISDEAAPPNVLAALGDGYALSPYDRAAPLAGQLAAAKLAVICPNGASNDPMRLSGLLEALDHTSAVAVLMMPDDARAGWRAVAGRSGQFVCLPSSATAEQVAAKLSAAEALQPAIQNLQDELTNARKIAGSRSGRIEDMDEEMRLAARLQRDFLPRRMPEIGPVRFGVLYRPASWLSGDIYDVQRLDERHVGFYVADAVGHGMPAALLTMFIKHALQTKRIVGHSYQIIPPEVSLAELNDDICQQNLSSCQFCTAVYAVLDTQDLTLTYARAGHPPPVVVRAQSKGAVAAAFAATNRRPNVAANTAATAPGVATAHIQMEALDAPGSLLGVFPEEQFESRQVRLGVGDRVVVFSDGAEDALRSAQQDPLADFGQLIEPIAMLPRDEMLLALTGWFDDCPPNPTCEDDITVMVVDIERD